MKIAFVHTSFPSSGDTFITNQETGLLDLGHEVCIFASAPQPNINRLNEDIVKYALLKKARYYGKRKGIAGVAKAIGSDLLHTPFSAIRSLIKSLDLNLFERRGRLLIQGSTLLDLDFTFRNKERFLNAYLLLRTFRAHDDVNVWNVHFGPVCNKMLFLKELYPHAKFVANFHGYDFSSTVRAFGSDYYAKLFKLANLITTQSFYSRDCLISLGCPPEKVMKHPVGADLNLFRFKNRVWTDDGSPIRLIIASRFVEKKGHRVLLDAFRKIVERKKNVELHIVGGGELEQSIRRQISQHEGLKQKTILHGWMTHEALAKHLEAMHVFVQPSLTGMLWGEQEDTTTTLIEAQAMGLPVVSTYHAGIPEVVEHGKTGLLVPERNVQALADAILHLIDNPQRLSEMGRAGRALVERQFDIRNLNRKLAFVFDKLCQLQGNEHLNLESSEQILFVDEQNSFPAYAAGARTISRHRVGGCSCHIL
ncbi:MAG: D-inositol-3-phosphate glycosyltransferase [bacterium]|nr:D-inositol-3-phosphate glycosyltransferase [bacterium]